LKETQIVWPDAQKRRNISKDMDEKYGLRGCIGMVDGTHIGLSQRPAISGETYFNRKQSYSLNVQAVCTHENEIIYFKTGYPGSCHDAYVWYTTQIGQTPDTYLSDGEYLLGDSAYALSTKMVTPYKNPAAQV
jgi:hypothetical protein